MRKSPSIFGRAALALLLALAPEVAFAAYTGSPPLLVANGGTGAQTLAAHGPLVGEGTGAIVAITPGATAGVALISGGSSADPSYGTVVPAGGGTGLVTLTAHNLLVGEGTSNVAFVAPQADSVVQWAGSTSADPAAVAIANCATAETYSTSTHTWGCNASAGIVPTTATASGSSPITIAATNLLTTIVSMGTPAASTINLPTAVQTAGWRECIKDGTTNFATNNATVKSPTAGTIDGVAGATGIVMNQAHQELCFISDSSNWFIE